MTFLAATLFVVIISIALIYKVTDRFGFRLKLSSIALCAVLAVAVNFAAIMMSPYLTEEHFIRLGVLVVMAAAAVTVYNEYLLRRDARLAAAEVSTLPLTEAEMGMAEADGEVLATPNDEKEPAFAAAIEPVGAIEPAERAEGELTFAEKLRKKAMERREKIIKLQEEKERLDEMKRLDELAKAREEEKAKEELAEKKRRQEEEKAAAEREKKRQEEQAAREKREQEEQARRDQEEKARREREKIERAEQERREREERAEQERREQEERAEQERRQHDPDHVDRDRAAAAHEIQRQQHDEVCQPKLHPRHGEKGRELRLRIAQDQSQRNKKSITGDRLSVHTISSADNDVYAGIIGCADDLNYDLVRQADHRLTDTADTSHADAQSIRAVRLLDPRSPVPDHEQICPAVHTGDLICPVLGERKGANDLTSDAYLYSLAGVCVQ